MRDRYLSRETERPDPLDAMLQDSYARARRVFRVTALAALLAFALLIEVVMAVLR